MKSLDCYRNKAIRRKNDIIADVGRKTPTLEDMYNMKWFISILPENYATDHNNSALQMQKQLAESLTGPYLSVSPIFHHVYWLHTFISYSKVFICWSKNATSILFCLHFFTFCPSCFKAILPQGSKQPRGFTLSSLFEVSASATTAAFPVASIYGHPWNSPWRSNLLRKRILEEKYFRGFATEDTENVMAKSFLLWWCITTSTLILPFLRIK